MNDINLHKKTILWGIFSLWLNWAYPMMAVAVVLILAAYCPKSILPLLIYTLAAIMLIILRKNRNHDAPHCFKTPYMVILILMWTATFYLVLNCLGLFKMTVGPTPSGQPYNDSIPWIPVLVLAPFGVLVSLWFSSRKKREFCADCEARNGLQVERGYISQLYETESRFQTVFMDWMWTIMAIGTWLYYTLAFHNSDINRADYYFFTYAPSVALTLTVIYMGFRYRALYLYYSSDEAMEEDNLTGKSKIRYLVICGDTLWLHVPDENEPLEPDAPVTMRRIDTPVKTAINFRRNFNVIEAGNYFRDLTGIRGADVRFLYESADKHALVNVFHFAVYINSVEDVKDSRFSGEWFNFCKIQTLHEMGFLSNMLEAELHRIHTIVMAWKTYTPQGKRIYEIKHYRPTFRLSDMHSWDVNYNDPKWLFIAMNNEDRPFFRFRKLWRKLITGTGY